MRRLLLILALLSLTALSVRAKEKRPDDPPLVQAAGNGDVAKVRELLKNGEKPDHVLEAGDTSALMKAADRGSIEIMTLLLDAGAKVDFTECSGWTALDYACEHADVEAVTILLKRGADVKHVSFFGGTVLHHLVLSCDHRSNPKRHPGGAACAKLLLDAGADVNAKRSGGQTALMIAVYSQNQEIVELLVKRGADVAAKTTEGETALQLARESDTGRHTETSAAIVKLLVDHGAKE